MKDIVTNYEEAMELVNQILQFGQMSIEIITCMIIDIEALKYKEPAVDIAERIWDAVQAVNEDLGPYAPRQGEDHDHKN